MIGGKLKFIILFALVPTLVYADTLPLDEALRATYRACINIDSELSDLKKMAGINTAVTGVGTGVGIAATTVGIVKANKDSQVEELEKLIAELEELSGQGATVSDADKQRFLQEFELSYDNALQEINAIKNTQDQLNQQSKKLGNWRTGLLAGSTATNVAGAIIAGENKVDADLQTQIDNCKSAVKDLRNSIAQARLSGENTDEADTIAEACGEYEYVDISPINNRAKGAMVSSVVGTTTGLAGTVTSAFANTEKTRQEGGKKEKDLNTASNVLAGTTTLASGVATAFNATQISAIKKVAVVAEKCTGVLK